MTPTVQVFLGLLFLATAALTAARLWLLFTARKVRPMLSGILDALIAKLENPRDLFREIQVNPSTELSQKGSVSREVVQYFVYPAKGHFVSFHRISKKGRQPTYKLDHWHPDPEVAGFPGWPWSCRSSWFVDRMHRVTNLIDAYPRERLLSNQADERG